MSKEPIRPKLTPLEKQTLDRLLAKAGQAGTAAAPPSWSPEAVEERRLRAEQQKLAAKEARTAARLAQLRSALDRVTGELQQTVTMRVSSRLNTPEIGRRLRHYRETFAEHVLPGWAASNGTLPDVADVLRAFVAADIATDAARRAGVTQQQKYDGAADEQRIERERAELARAIVNAGRAARNEPPLDVIQLVPYTPPKPKDDQQ